MLDGDGVVVRSSTGSLTVSRWWVAHCSGSGRHARGHGTHPRAGRRRLALRRWASAPVGFSRTRRAHRPSSQPEPRCVVPVDVSVSSARPAPSFRQAGCPSAWRSAGGLTLGGIALRLGGSCDPRSRMVAEQHGEAVGGRRSEVRPVRRRRESVHLRPSSGCAAACSWHDEPPPVHTGTFVPHASAIRARQSGVLCAWSNFSRAVASRWRSSTPGSEHPRGAGPLQMRRHRSTGSGRR